MQMKIELLVEASFSLQMNAQVLPSLTACRIRSYMWPLVKTSILDRGTESMAFACDFFL